MGFIFCISLFVGKNIGVIVGPLVAIVVVITMIIIALVIVLICKRYVYRNSNKFSSGKCFK